ncbi:MAG: hypothetical protein D6767_04490 [Candidatus Hydrogenedentota bacterium]|nr:MAG: hypothetical protein D6767_04490 [Candidatus Hydrogenedentota bacterium]
MSKLKVNVKWLENHNISVLYSEPVLYHCNFFNFYLQRTIEDAQEYVPAEEILTDGGEMAAYAALSRLFEVNTQFQTAEEKLKVAAELYKHLGFGLIDNLASLSEEGGSLETPITHYSVGWKEVWGERKKPADYFTCGYIAAALAVAYGKTTGTYQVKQTKCLTLGHETNEFTAQVRPTKKEIRKSPGVGKLNEKIPELPKLTSNVNAEEITKAVREMQLVGNDQGLIPAFGVFLTRHFANYYNYIVYETAKKMGEATGDDEIAKMLFIESGHVCAFNTLGGIMVSPEWEGLVQPQIQNEDDILHGIIAVMNSLGWGHWCLSEHDGAKKMVACVFSDYEANGYLAMYGKASHPISYFATGCSAGLMNLIYKGNIASKPKLTYEFYQNLFNKEDSYVAIQTKCRALGDDRCQVEVKAQ